MYAIIKSVLGTSEPLYYEKLNFLIASDKKQLLNRDELRAIRYLLEIFDNNQKFPTENLFYQEFPELEEVVDMEEPLDVHDFDIVLDNIIEERTNQKVSSDVSDISAKIMEEGFSEEYFDKLRSLYNLNRTVEIDESTLTLDDAQSIYDLKAEQPIGLQTYIDEIDDRIGGIPKGSVFLLFGYTSQFKTLTALNIAYNNVYRLGYNIVYITLEDPKFHHKANILARHSFENKFTEFPFIPHKKIKEQRLTEEEYDFVFNTVRPDFMEADGNFIILDETDFHTFSFAEITSKLQDVDDKTEGGVDAVVFDHANLFRFSDSVFNVTSQMDVINKYVSFIRQLSMDFKKDPETGVKKELASIVLAQANRQGFKRANKKEGRYDLRAIAEANELERASQRIMSVYTNENLKQSNEMKVQLLKNRGGPTLFDPVKVYVNPVPYVAGDEVEEFNTMVDNEAFDSMLSEEFDSAFGDDSLL